RGVAHIVPLPGTVVFSSGIPHPHLLGDLPGTSSYATDSGLFTGISGEVRKRARSAKVANAQISGAKQLDVSVVKEAVHPIVVARRVMRFTRGADEGQKRRAWRSGDAGV